MVKKIFGKKKFDKCLIFWQTSFTFVLVPNNDRHCAEQK